MIRFPRRLETQYAARLARRQRMMRILLGERLEWLTRRDADGDDAKVGAVVAATQRAWEVAVPVEADSLLGLARAVDFWATRSTAREVDRIVAVDIEAPGRISVRTRRGMRILHLDWARENVALIKTMESDTFSQVAAAVVESVVDGDTRLAAVLQDRFGVARSRAKLIARDQVGALNARVTEARQVDLGIRSYRWSTSGDQRVRPEHRALDGSIRKWSDPHPSEVHPGRAIACRCVAIPEV